MDLSLLGSEQLKVFWLHCLVSCDAVFY